MLARQQEVVQARLTSKQTKYRTLLSVTNQIHHIFRQHACNAEVSAGNCHKMCSSEARGYSVRSSRDVF